MFEKLQGTSSQILTCIQITYLSTDSDSLVIVGGTVSPQIHIDVLTPRALDNDLTWRQGYC